MEGRAGRLESKRILKIFYSENFFAVIKEPSLLICDLHTFFNRAYP